MGAIGGYIVDATPHFSKLMAESMEVSSRASGSGGGRKHHFRVPIGAGERVRADLVLVDLVRVRDGAKLEG